jgi:thiol-disulfide isomerase/thioredoxin
MNKIATMKNILFVTCVLLSSLTYAQKLRFKVEGLKDTTVFLTKYYGQKLFYADTAVMKGGIAEFTANPNLKPGVLALLMPGQKYFEFIYNNEEIYIETKGPDFVSNMKVKKSEENKIFVAYIQYLQAQRNTATAIRAKRDALQSTDPQYKKYSDQLDSISKIVSSYQANLIQTHSTKLVGKIVKMSIDIVIPEAPKNEKGIVIDSNFRYNYYRAHYWDNVDLSDDRLVNTQVFHQKLEYYFGKNMLLQHPDTVLNVAIPFCNKLKPGSEMFKYCVDYITNNAAKSNIMGMDKVFVMMVDNFYCKNDPATGKSRAYWMPAEKLEDLCKDNEIKKHLVQGVVPPNVILRDTTDKKWIGFMNLPSEYTILYFWDPECGHCKKTTPKLQRLYEEKLKARNVEVFAVGKATDEDFEKWKKFIRDNHLTFINVGMTKSLYEEAIKDPSNLVPIPGDNRPKPTTLESLNYHDTYDLYATPRIFVLDKDKKIIAKQLTISQLEDLLDRLQKVKDPVKLFPPDPEEEAH